MGLEEMRMEDGGFGVGMLDSPRGWAIDSL